MKTIKREFVPVAVDADVLNFLDDADGKFARSSGVYLFGSSGGVAFVTASGKQLGKKHLHGTNAAGIEEALQAWNKLPESERRPGAIQLGKRGPINTKRAAVEPPAGGLILKLHGRYLARPRGRAAHHHPRQGFSRHRATRQGRALRVLL